MGAVAYVRDIGGMHNLIMDDIACQIWQFAYDNGLWLTASFIPGVENTDSDIASRILSERSEWTLPDSVFQQLTHKFFIPSIDLFASD